MKTYRSGPAFEASGGCGSRSLGSEWFAADLPSFSVGTSRRSLLRDHRFALPVWEEFLRILVFVRARRIDFGPVDPTPSLQSSSDPDDVTAVIAGAGLDERQSGFLLHRWLHQVRWMDRRADAAQRRYYFARLTTILGGVSVPALLSVHRDEAHLAAGILSLIVAASAAVEEFFHYGERWRHYRATAESLKSEGWRFLERSGPYAPPRSLEHAYEQFVDKVERVIHRDVEVYLSRVTRDEEPSGRQS
jgi:hypothetical protein